MEYGGQENHRGIVDTQPGAWGAVRVSTCCVHAPVRMPALGLSVCLSVSIGTDYFFHFFLHCTVLHCADLATLRYEPLCTGMDADF